MNYNFSFDEKACVLKRHGFRVEKHTIKIWEQWGNHDNQGDWEDHTNWFALKDNMKPALNNTVETMFVILLHQRERNKREEFLNSI